MTDFLIKTASRRLRASSSPFLEASSLGMGECGGRLISAWCRDTADETSETNCSLQTQTKEYSQRIMVLIIIIIKKQSFEAKLLNWQCTTYFFTARYAHWHEGQQRRSSPPVCSGPASGLSTPVDNSESPLHPVVLD